LAKSELEKEFAQQLDVIKVPIYLRDCLLKKIMFCERQWRCDFAWPEYELIVEIEGGTYTKNPGRHNRALGFKQDCEKYNHCALNNFKVLRFDSYHVKHGFAIITVAEFFGIKI
jgi:very-short-patch-repair endonuclease